MTARALAAAAAALLLARAPARASDGATPADDPTGGLQALFSAAGPRDLHYRARVVDARGQPHDLEVWRRDDSRVRRRTDGRMEIFAERRGEGVALVVRDLRTDSAYTASDTDLFAMGHRMRWADLAYGLRLPPGDRVLLSAGRAVRSRVPAAPTCREYTATVGKTRFSFCWAEALKLPLAIRDARGRALFEVREASTAAPAPDVYDAPAVPPAGD